MIDEILRMWEYSNRLFEMYIFYCDGKVLAVLITLSRMSVISREGLEDVKRNVSCQFPVSNFS
jgi:hypothetical protein